MATVSDPLIGAQGPVTVGQTDTKTWTQTFYDLKDSISQRVTQFARGLFYGLRLNGALEALKSALTPKPPRVVTIGGSSNGSQIYYKDPGLL